MSESGKPGSSQGSSQGSGAGKSPRLPIGTHDALRFAGAGMELGGSAIACAAIGYAIDHYFQNDTKIATALGAVLGFSGGLFRFIKLAMAASHDPNRDDK